MTQTAIMDPRVQARISGQPELAVALLQHVLPPSAAVVVGANRLNPAWLNWPGLPADRILLVDAQNERLQAIHQHLPHTRGWRSCEAVLDAADGRATFHALSHANESGLLSASSLQALWPNIRSVSATERKAQRLDSLLGQGELLYIPDEATSWLVIESLPAVRILRGAEQYLQRCSTVALRVLVGHAAEAGIDGATLEEACGELEPLGFRHAFSLEETHPDILTAVFVREPAAAGPIEEAVAEMAAVTEARDAALRERDGLQDQIQALKNQVDALIEERGDLTHAWENDVRAKEEAFAARDAERTATTEAMKARDQALAMLQKKEAEFAALNKEKAELQASRDEALKQLEQMTADQASTAQAQEDSITQLTQERDEARKQLAEQSERMQELEAENAEAHRRHQLMQDEMVKAEAQIELIKDLLLREQGA